MRKTTVWSRCSIFSHGSHVFDGSKITTSVLCRIPQGTFLPSLVSNWSSSVVVEDFWKIVNDDDDIWVKIQVFFVNNSKTVEINKILLGVILFTIRRRTYAEIDNISNSPHDVGVMAPETDFFYIFHVYNFENLVLLNHATQFNES